MPWQSDAAHAGFTRGSPWLPVDPAHRALAVDLQQANPQSTLQWTRMLLALRRRHPALRVGSFDVEHADDGLLIVRRKHGEETLWLAFHFGAGVRTFAAPEAAGSTLISLGQARLLEDQVELPAHSAIVLRLDP
jgi:alpha-glucosidase